MTIADARWYCLSHDGMATLCVDEPDAQMNARQNDVLWPRAAPHQAVQLIDAAQLTAEQKRTRVFARWAMEALLALETIDPDDSEDGGEHLRMLMGRGRRLVDAVVLSKP